jgi:hypothetical protein
VAVFARRKVTRRARRQFFVEKMGVRRRASSLAGTEHTKYANRSADGNRQNVARLYRAGRAVVAFAIDPNPA